MTRSPVIVIITVIVFAFALLCMAAPSPEAQERDARQWRSWCGSLGSGPTLGWHFYCDPAWDPDIDPARDPVIDPVTGPTRADTPPAATGTAGERILNMRRALEESRAAAVLDPTPQNVAAYLELQQAALGRAAAFSDAFRRTVWARPDLDYTLERPVGALAKQLWSEERRTQRGVALADLSERYGLIYLGHADCSGCRVSGPLLRAFALRHGLDVLAVSMTGEALEGWPEAVPDNGRAAKLGLDGVSLPAVVLFDTETGTVRPVGFGVMAEDQLAERIFVLTSLETGSDY